MGVAIVSMLALATPLCNAFVVTPPSSFGTNRKVQLSLWQDDTSEITMLHIEEEASRLEVPLIGMGQGTFDKHGVKWNVWDVAKRLAKWLPNKDSVEATTMVLDILSRIEDFDVNTLRKYRAYNILFSILALSRLQHASLRYTEQSRQHEEVQSPELLEVLKDYAPLASVAYGCWVHNLLFHTNYTNIKEALLHEKNITEDDILVEHWDHNPPYFLVRDTMHKKLVLSIRGTYMGQDVLIDLCAKGAGTHDAHAGMVRYADGIKQQEEKDSAIADHLESHNEFSLVIVGHSLGGGVASLLGSEWKNKFHDMTVYAYGCPCVAPINAEPTRSKSTFSVVAEGDPFLSLSLGHIAELSRMLAKLCENPKLQKDIFMKTASRGNDLQWCHDELEKMRKDVSVNQMHDGKEHVEKMYPSGHVHYVYKHDNKFALQEVPNDYFQDFILTYILSLSNHFCSSYEDYLRQC